MVKVCVIVTGRTLNAHKAFVDNLSARVPLTEVTLEECDVILEFCPISSRPGTDIDAALAEIPDGKPVILVVMHHVSDPNRRPHPSSGFVTQSHVFTVDCLFHEAKGFFKSAANDAAVEKTLGHIRRYEKEPPRAQKLAEKHPPAQEFPKMNHVNTPQWTDENPHPQQDLDRIKQGENQNARKPWKCNLQ